jgi:hypothetical protein
MPSKYLDPETSAAVNNMPWKPDENPSREVFQPYRVFNVGVSATF